MSERANFAAPAARNIKTKRQTTVSATPSSSRTKIPANNVRDKTAVPRPKTNTNSKNTTVLGPGDVSMLKHEIAMPDFDSENRQVAYGKFLRSLLTDCLADDHIEREETQIDVQMAQLSDRFQKTMDVLDKTNRRLKDISFVVEQKRLLDLKNNDSSQYYNTTENSKAEELINNLNATAQAKLNKLDTKNVDFGYSKETGHKQLLDAVNDALEGLDQIKKNSKLDSDKFKEYIKSQTTLEDIEKDRFDLDTVKSEFETKFPKFSEKLLKEASERVMSMFQNDTESNGDSDDD